MDRFPENAQEILEVAGAGRETGDFEILVRDDGGLHFLMETPFALDRAAAYAGARIG